tara:strand:- start:119 stop:343 length:225 start_codon:yes stop_codon:yes gene_type:complete
MDSQMNHVVLAVWIKQVEQVLTELHVLDICKYQVLVVGRHFLAVGKLQNVVILVEWVWYAYLGRHNPIQDTSIA